MEKMIIGKYTQTRQRNELIKTRRIRPWTGSERKRRRVNEREMELVSEQAGDRKANARKRARMRVSEKYTPIVHSGKTHKQAQAIVFCTYRHNTRCDGRVLSKWENSPNWKRQTADSSARIHTESKWDKNRSVKKLDVVRVFSLLSHIIKVAARHTHIHVYAYIFLANAFFRCCCWLVLLFFRCCCHCCCCCCCIHPAERLAVSLYEKFSMIFATQRNGYTSKLVRARISLGRIFVTHIRFITRSATGLPVVSVFRVKN